MTQQELLLDYIDHYGYIVPAKMGGKEYNGGYFGSETSKRARELRADGILDSRPHPNSPKFEVFFRAGNLPAMYKKELNEADLLKLSML